jgi:tetratricopeptide (TPR) repeat protein
VENAVTNLQKLITLNPGNPSYYNMITDVFELAMGTPQQEAIFATLLSLDPGNPDLLMRKAELEKIKGNYTAYYENMKTLFADASIPIDKKIFFLVPFVDSVELKNFVQKEFVFELTTILTKTHPDDAKAFAMRADFLYYDKQTQEARKHYRQSVSIRQDVYDVWLKLLYIDAGEGQNDSLLYVSGQCIELFPNQPTAYYFNGIALMGLMRYQDAVKSFKKALPMAVGNPQLKGDIYLRLGDVYNELKNYTESDAAYEASLQLDPKNPYTLNNYAYHLSLRSERLDDAAIMAKLANELVPGNPSLLDTYAWILYKQQNFKEAKKWLEEAMQKGGNKSVVIVEHYGDVLFRLGEKETALQYWNKAKQLGTGSEFLERKISEGILYE